MVSAVYIFHFILPFCKWETVYLLCLGSGLKFTNVVVGVQIEYSTTGPLETTQAVGEDIVSSWSDWAYNANANNGAIDAVQIFVTADLVTPEPTHDPTYNPTFAELTADPTKDPTSYV